MATPRKGKGKKMDGQDMDNLQARTRDMDDLMERRKASPPSKTSANRARKPKPASGASWTYITIALTIMAAGGAYFVCISSLLQLVEAHD